MSGSGDEDFPPIITSQNISGGLRPKTSPIRPLNPKTSDSPDAYEELSKAFNTSSQHTSDERSLGLGDRQFEKSARDAQQQRERMRRKSRESKESGEPRELDFDEDSRINFPSSSVPPMFPFDDPLPFPSSFDDTLPFPSSSDDPFPPSSSDDPFPPSSSFDASISESSREGRRGGRRSFRLTGEQRQNRRISDGLRFPSLSETLPSSSTSATLPNVGSTSSFSVVSGGSSGSHPELAALMDNLGMGENDEQDMTDLLGSSLDMNEHERQRPSIDTSNFSSKRGRSRYS
jgi:hypothetical protein